MQPKITVIICTYNRGYLLSETVPTIFQQNITKDKYQVLIVNNNSNDETTKILRGLCAEYENLSVIDEPKQGLSHAKNTGMTATKTEWIIYLDDDAKVPNNFIEIAINNIDDSNFQCFGGVYLPWFKYGKPKWFLDSYASNQGKLSEFGILKKDFIAGGIMAIKKSLLQELDGFPTDIGMTGDQIGYGEETQLQIRLRKVGYEIGYDPNWVIYHLVNRYKLSPWWFVKSGFAAGRDAHITYNENPSIKLILKYFYQSIKFLFTNLIKFTPQLFNKKYYWQNWLIDVVRPTVLKYGQIYSGIKHLR